MDDTSRAIAALRARADVLYAEPNFMRYKDAVPNDPRYAEQWALKNTGQSGGTVGADIKAEQAWDITTGSRNVVVGVVDEGIDINHPDLRDNIWTNPAPGSIPGIADDLHGYDFVNNSGAISADDHATHVAGIIGAAGNNSIGVVGVNWQVNLMSLKFIGPNGGTSANLLKALSYAKTMRDLWGSSGGTKGANIRVLNNSYGGGGRSQAELDAINALGQLEILFVAAAGNQTQDNDRFPNYPSNYNTANVISVASTNRFDLVSSFSNYGSTTVGMAAPGESILSTTAQGTYAVFSGTSMASPQVAGAAALICAANPNSPLSRIRAALMYSGEQLPSLAKTVSGRRLNLLRSLQAALEADSTPPADITNFRISSQNGRTVTLTWTAPGDDGNSGTASAYEIRFSDSAFADVTAFQQAQAFAAPVPGPCPGPAATFTLFKPATCTGVGLKELKAPLP